MSYIVSRLSDCYDYDEASALAWWIAEERTGLSRTQLQFGCKDTTKFPHLQTDDPKIDEIIIRLRHFEPIQYIFGHTEWMGLNLKVTPATLIPRPETAELVERVNNRFPSSTTSRPPMRLLDIGTGSGCIAIALKQQHPEWQITGIDISAEAIEIARENAQCNGVEVNFLQMDIFSVETEAFEPFDIITSNPPYICEKEKEGMRRNVLEHEPETALFVPDNDPLLFYRRIATLHKGRHLFCEINEAYPAEMVQLLSNEGYTEIHIHPDIYGKSRIIEGRMAK